MNTQYFTEVINELNRVAPYLTEYQAYVNRTLQTENLSCAQLAELAASTAAKLTQSNVQIAAVSSKAVSDISAMQSAITASLAALAPLLVAPTDLPSLLTWATAVVATFAGPQASLIAQEAVIAAQLTQITNAVTGTTSAVATLASSLTSAIQAARAKKGCV